MNLIDTDTRLFAVIGHPVAHSLGPLMHNLAFSTAGINGAYLAFDVIDLAGAIAGIRALNIRGISVTVPHKVAIMPYLDKIDDVAEAIGAVNTVINDNGKLIGTNTDAHGAVTALAAHAGDLRGKKLIILGAGGAARAVGFGAVQKGAIVHIVNRTRSTGEALANRLNAHYHDPSELDAIPYDILVNTTPVGMTPHPDEMPVPKNILKPGAIVMDIIYNPVKTRLLREAEKRGCKIIDGVSMFVHQGARQFSLWTGKTPPVKKMHEIVYEALDLVETRHALSSPSPDLVL